MKPQTGSAAAETASLEIAKRFVAARRKALPLNDFPGEIPADLQTAYGIQDAAIGLWPDPIGGWKVGRIPAALEDGFGVDRLAGPILRKRSGSPQASSASKCRYFRAASRPSRRSTSR